MSLSSVVIDRRVLDGWKRRAMKHHPKEHIEALCGKVKGDTAHVYAIVPIKIIRRDSESVEYEPLAMETFEGLKVAPIGTIHTHPNSGYQPSDTDWAGFSSDGDDCDPEVVMGVMGITATRKRRFTSYGFWSHSNQLELIISESAVARRPVR